MLTSQQIANYCHALGFEIVGFSHCLIDDEYLLKIEKQYFNHKLLIRKNLPYQDYINVAKVVSNPQLIISVGLSYHQKNISTTKKMIGHFSKASYGQDYHQLIYAKLDEIVNYLKKEKADLEYFYSCDTKILDDRYFAYLCGNGFYGKNSMIINEKYGSEVFYGTIVCDLEVNFEQPQLIESKCGTCQLCELSCPTNSLNNYELDYKSCLAYLTQSRELFKPQLINSVIYGCDICNNICPFNDDVKDTAAFKEQIGYLDLCEVIVLSKNDYHQQFNDKSFSWLNHNIMKKNAILALQPYLKTNYDDIYQLYRKVEQQMTSPLIKEAFEYILKDDYFDEI
ncbi:DUF1730 domain-containing protein [Erysipelotrichaceae bacterium OttesenSCG-928-M19]|nr:DUF1730 domain-containing protein [Erysipelotrichaceae bacterium OttesenSCG-928-M19]